VGRYYQKLDFPHFDYAIQPCPNAEDQYIRGPVPDLGQPYFICVGAAQTFGRFCEMPFPKLLSDALGIPVLNLGLAGSGPKTFQDLRFLSLINGAKFAIMQVLSGRSESNSGFDNDGTDGPTGVRLSDHKRMRFEDFIRSELENSPQSQVRRLVEETQENWIESYARLLHGITVPTILHWFSQVRPRRQNDYSSFPRLVGHFPQLVIQSMVDRVSAMTDFYVETVCNEGMPQALWKADRVVDGTELHDGMLYNKYYPTPEMHRAAAANISRLVIGWTG